MKFVIATFRNTENIENNRKGKICPFVFYVLGHQVFNHKGKWSFNIILWLILQCPSDSEIICWSYMYLISKWVFVKLFKFQFKVDTFIYVYMILKNFFVNFVK